MGDDSHIPLVPNAEEPGSPSLVPLQNPRSAPEFRVDDGPSSTYQPVVPHASPEADRHLREGEDAFRRGDYERAVSEFTRCVLLNPHRHEVYLKRADAWKALGRYDTAANDMTMVLQHLPGDERASAGRGQLLSFLGRFREAASDYTTAIDRNPTNPSYYLSRGQAHSRLADWLPAVADFARAIDLGPGNAVAYLERGTAVLHAGGDLTQAAADLSRAIQLNPFLGLAYARRADVHQRQGKNDLATADLTEAVRLDPTNAQLLAAKAEALAKAGAETAAMADYAAALRLEPNNPKLWVGQGRRHAAGGRLDAAEASLDEAVRLDTTGVEGVIARGDVRFERGNLDGAMSDYSVATHRQPDNGLAWLGQGRVHLARNDYDLASRPLERAIELAPMSADAHFHRGRWNTHQNRLEQALADVTRALELNPELVEARRLRADLFVRLNRSDEAYNDLAQLIRHLPRDPLVYLLRGKLEFRRQRLDSAGRDLSMALKLDPNNTEARVERALVLRGLRKNWDSLVDLVQAVQQDTAYAAEYMVQRAIVAGARKQYNRALADLAVALHLDPTNRTAEKAKEMVQQLKAVAEPRAVTGGSGEPLSREMLQAANDLLGGPELGIKKRPPLTKQKRKLAAKRGAKKLPRVPKPAPPPVVSVDSQIAAQLLEPPAVDLADEAGAPSAHPKQPPAPVRSPGPLTSTATALPPNPGTGTFKPVAGPGGTGTFKVKVKPPEPKKGGFLGGLFGAKSAAKPTVTAPNRKPSKQDQEEEAKAKRAKIFQYVKIGIIPIGFIAVAWMLWSQFSGPDVEGALREAEKAGYPVSATLKADELWAQFARDDDAKKAGDKFDEQYVEVSGKVKKVINTKDKVAILLAAGSGSNGVECRLLKKEDLEGVKEGDEVTVQGQSPGRQKNEPHVTLGICRVRPR